VLHAPDSLRWGGLGGGGGPGRELFREVAGVGVVSCCGEVDGFLAGGAERGDLCGGKEVADYDIAVGLELVEEGRCGRWWRWR
jgi:hypothetical protein